MLKNSLFTLLLILILSIIWPNTFAQHKRCETKESFHVDSSFDCAITPSSLERSFYITIHHIKRGTTYSCSFKSRPTILMLRIEGSIFPDGMTYECKEACPYFPLELVLHTEKMFLEDSSVQIKYHVPGFIDIPVDVNVTCKKLAK